MKTEQRAFFSDSTQMSPIDDGTIGLVVTSPPYPMIRMWDDGFCRHPSIKQALLKGNGGLAFERMHRQLDRVWDELLRVVMPGGIVCINIGDAVRTLKDEFALYPNHSRILSHMTTIGFTNLPNILWRKPTNAPTKFMGSGMLPPGAYVTLEHEHILIFRKGGKRTFNSAANKAVRRQSAFFWEERNRWFSDVWMDLRGTRQNTDDERLRQRTAAFPFEMAYRLIVMFSIMGDTVLDPFLGTGTTLFAAAAAGRNGIGFELDAAFRSVIASGWPQAIQQGRRRLQDRFSDHAAFVHEHQTAGKAVKYTNKAYGFPVMTRQETELMIPWPTTVAETEPDCFSVAYDLPKLSDITKTATVEQPSLTQSTGQLKLFD